jgi:hypothetical protein
LGFNPKQGNLERISLIGQKLRRDLNTHLHWESLFAELSWACRAGITAHNIPAVQLLNSIHFHGSFFLLGPYLPFSSLSPAFFFFFFFYSCSSDLEHRASVKRFVSLHFLNLKPSIGLLGRGISPFESRYLTQTQNKHRHPCLE